MSDCCRVPENIAVVQEMEDPVKGHGYFVPDPRPELDDGRGGGWALECLTCGTDIRACERCGFVGDTFEVSNHNFPFGDGWGAPDICKACASAVRTFALTPVEVTPGLRNQEVDQ